MYNSDLVYKLIYCASIYALIFGACYLYGRKAHPKKSLRLTTGAWLALMIISFFQGTIGGLIATVVVIVFLRVLRKPNANPALQKFYKDNSIYAVDKKLPAVTAVLGDKKWLTAEGKLSADSNYFFWQGHTTHFVSAGQYTRTTTFQHFVAFIFPAGSVNEHFRNNVIAAADKSGYTCWQKVNYFFNPDFNKPMLVKTATDGSFVVEFQTIPDAEHYALQLDWIKAQFSKQSIVSSERFCLN